MKSLGHQSGRFAIVPARAVDDRRLSRSTLAMLVTLGTYSDRNGWCWPSVSTLAVRLGISERQVKRAIRELEKLGYIETQRQFDNRGLEISARRRILFDAEPPSDMDDIFKGGGATCHPRGGVTRHPGVSPEGQKGVVSDDTQTYQRTSHTHSPLRGDENEPADVDNNFETFWQKYPSRGSHSNPKKPAWEKFRTAVKQGVTSQAIITGAENYARHVARDRIEPRYVKQAKTWLNQECWAEYQEEPAVALPSDDGWL